MGDKANKMDEVIGIANDILSILLQIEKNEKNADACKTSAFFLISQIIYYLI